MNPDSKASLQFRDYFVENINFDRPLGHISDGKLNLSTDFTHKSQLNEEENQARVVLGVNIYPEKEEDLFSISLKLVGFFDIEVAELEKDEIQQLITLNATAILFPYLRSLVSQITMAANLPEPIILPTMNIGRMIEQQIEHE